MREFALIDLSRNQYICPYRDPAPSPSCPSPYVTTHYLEDRVDDVPVTWFLERVDDPAGGYLYLYVAEL